MPCIEKPILIENSLYIYIKYIYCKEHQSVFACISRLFRTTTDNNDVVFNLTCDPILRGGLIRESLTIYAWMHGCMYVCMEMGCWTVNEKYHYIKLQVISQLLIIRFPSILLLLLLLLYCHTLFSKNTQTRKVIVV